MDCAVNLTSDLEAGAESSRCGASAGVAQAHNNTQYDVSVSLAVHANVTVRVELREWH
jgi:hypothetical protein